MAEDPFFQALEFSVRKIPGRGRTCEKAQSQRQSIVFSGGSYCYENQYNLHDLDEDKDGVRPERL